MTTTHDENMTLLMHDTTRAQLVVNTYVDVPLSQNEFDALVDFVFNIGPENFKESTVLKLLNQKDYEGAAKRLEDWSMSKGVMLAGLLRRRMQEEALFDTPDENQPVVLSEATPIVPNPAGES
ncbi:MAG: lysozyme [Patescibacteria group bacterium]|nr:lysozyme [Patescibacteria group bacterium]